MQVQTHIVYTQLYPYRAGTVHVIPIIAMHSPSDNGPYVPAPKVWALFQNELFLKIQNSTSLIILEISSLR